MPQGRIVLKSICQSRKLAAIKTDGARLLYTWLLPNVDVNGCYSGDAVVLKGRIFTRLARSIKNINSYLQDLQENDLIVWYQANGDQYLFIPDFVDKQPQLNPSKEAKTTIPMPTPDQLQTKAGITPRKVKESKVKGKVKESKKNGEGFEKFWPEYPKKAGKGKALESWNKIKPSEELLAKMLNTLSWQKKTREWLKDDGQFIPHPATWLNQRRWEDEPYRRPNRGETDDEYQRRCRNKTRKDYTGWIADPARTPAELADFVDRCPHVKWLVDEIQAKTGE